MDEITYTVLETVNNESLTRDELYYSVEHKFEPTKHTEVVRIIALLFNANYLIIKSIPGFSITHTDKVYLSEDARKLFIKEKEEKEKFAEKDILDTKLKQISLSSLKVNKWLPVYALGIAIITTVVPFIIYYISNGDTQKTETSIPQLQKVLQTQEHRLQMQQQFQDSLLKILSSKK